MLTIHSSTPGLSLAKQTLSVLQCQSLSVCGTRRERSGICHGCVVYSMPSKQIIGQTIAYNSCIGGRRHDWGEHDYKHAATGGSGAFIQT